MTYLAAFSGVDGAGKSTQIKLLEASLKANSSKVVCIWARGGYTPFFGRLKLLMRRLARGKLPTPGPSSARDSMLEPGWKRNIWLLISIFDLFLLYCLWARLLHILGYTIIFDRYIEDTELDFRRNVSGLDISKWLSWRLLLLLSPKIKFRFLLIVPPKVSAYRSISKQEPFPDSFETLEWRFNQYCEMASKMEWFVLDGQNPISIINKKILSELDI